MSLSFNVPVEIAAHSALRDLEKPAPKKKS